MPVSILGINHKTAPVTVREKVAFEPNRLEQVLKSLKKDLELEEVAIISTCNRMEIIYRCPHHLISNDSTFCAEPPVKQQLADDQPLPIKEALTQTERKIIDWLAQHHQIESGQINAHYYVLSGSSAVSHLMSVACGLDSMVLGEPQILGQVKDAYGYACHAGSIGLYLNRLFQQTFSVAKQVRTETQIGESAVSVAYAAITLAKRIFSDFSQLTVLLIGAGETIELAAKHLLRQGVTNINVANRTVERAQILTSELNQQNQYAQAYSLSALPELVTHADIIISSTASPVPIIGKGLMEKAITARKHRSTLMVDLAVPRDIEAEVAELSDVYLYTVDDMQGVIQENLKQREAAAIEAKEFVSFHTTKYLAWLQSLNSVSLLKEFRTTFEKIKSSEVNRALSKLTSQSEDKNTINSVDFQDVEKVILDMANRLSNKFMHQPTQVIRQAGEKSDQKALKVLSDAFTLADK